MKIEIVEIDPKRWAWLHAPLGVGLGLLLVVKYFLQESGVDIEMFAEGVIVILIGAPCVVLCVMVVAWIQASILNGIIRMMGKGPVLLVRTLDEEPESTTTVEQQTDRALAAFMADKES